MKTMQNISKSIKHFTDKNSPVVVIEKSNYFSLPFFIMGAIIGVLAALFYAPDTGENNRKKLLDKIKELNKDDGINFQGSHIKNETAEDGEDKLERVRENLTRL